MATHTTSAPSDDLDFDAVFTPALSSDKAPAAVGHVQATPPRGRGSLYARALLESDAQTADRDNGRRW